MMFSAARFAKGSVVGFQVRKFSQNLAQDFAKASRAINSPENPKEVSNETKLKLYGLFKQSDTGPCTTSKPGLFDPVGRAKHDAWSKLGSLSKEDAMKSYVSEVMKVFDGKLPESAVEATPSAPKTVIKEELTLESVAFPRKRNLNFAELGLDTVATSISDKGVASIQLNRPNRGNSFNMKLWDDFRQSFARVEDCSNLRAVVLTGRKTFSTGMDLSVFVDLQKVSAKEPCESKKREGVSNFIGFLQDSISAPENCSVPVIAAIHGNCIGGAVDLISSCDLRYCTKDAVFCIKETDLAIVADIGTLQRLPKIIGNQQTAELTYTGRVFSGVEAVELGLCLKAFDTEVEMMTYVKNIAEQIASKSPITIRGVKKTLLYQRDHPVKDALNQVKVWNSAHVMSEDLLEATSAMMSKRDPVFRA